MPGPVDILRGTMDVLILRAVSWGPIHGYGVARWIEQVTGEALKVEEGTLYPALHRLEDRGLIEAEWGLSENNRRARYYSITPSGRKELRRETAAWTRFAQAMAAALAASASAPSASPAEG
ncbi:MAG TPA: PadR family transcriptional regulator [Gemmatimonadaceae bacterium]|nr:PadR family transcriptional regulator [Gemmatimonadaceae bacterium]